MFTLLTFQDPTRHPLAGDDMLAQLPPAASTFASDVDGLFYFCMWVSIFFFFFIAGVLVFTTVQNRRRTETQPAASNVTHNTTLEVIWTLVPTIILMVIFAWGWKGNLEQSVAPGDALQYRAVAKQWNWSFYHPGANRASVGKFWVPVNKPVKFTTSSTDVLHSFYVPAFRAKRDVLPGRYQTLWFKATEEGEYPMFCAEYCGRDHSRMMATVYVVSQEEYDREPWNTVPDDPIEWGEQIYSELCFSCHSIDGSKRVGPSFLGLWGREEEMEDGTREVVNRDYFARSVRNPASQIVKGYSNQMTAFGELDDEQIDALIQYIQTLKN